MAEEIGLSGVFDLSNWNKNVGRYQSDLGKMSSATDRAAGSFGKSWNQMGSVVAKVTATMGVAMVAAGAAAGAAIAGFAVSGIKKAADLEAQLSSIAATLNMTAEQVAPLNDLILELGLDPNLKVSATEAADAIENLARNGLSMTEILDGAARSTVLLANATGADFGVAADIATDTMALFNIAAEDMAVAVDGITGVTNASKFTIGDYRLALSQAGGVAAASGVSFADFNATITAISPAFASGSDAGTSFKTMLQRLIPQSTEAKDMMMKLGLMTEDGSNKFFDASGNMKSMNEVAILLNGALAGLTEEQRLNAVTILAGADASRAMLGLMESGAVVYTDAATAAKELGVSQEEVNKVLEGGVTQFEALALQLGSIDAAEQAATRMDNFKGSLEILQGTIETLQIRIGQAFLPLLQKIAEWATEWIATNGPAIAAAFEEFAASVSAVIDVFSHFAEKGELLSATEFGLSEDTAKLVDQFVELSIAVGTTLRDAFQFVQEHANAFKGVLIGIGAVLAAATITAGITAIVTALGTLLTPIGLVVLAAAGLGFVWNTNWLGMRDKTIAIVDEIKEAFKPLTTAIEEFGSGALTEIQAFVTGNETEFTNLKAIWEGAKESFTNVSTGIQESAASFVTYLKEQFPQLTPVIDGFSSAISLVVEQVKEQFTLLQDATSAMISLVTSLIEGDWTGAWQSAKDLVGAFVTYIEETFANLKEVFETPFTEIRDLVTETFTGLVADVTAQLPGWQAQLTEWGNAASQWITDAVPIVQQKMTEWAAAAQGYVTDNLPAWKTTLAEWGTAASQWIADASVIVAEKMTEWKTAVVDYVTENLPTWQATLTSWGDAASEWISDAIPIVKTQITAWYAETRGFVEDNLPNWIAILKSWGDAAWQWIVDAIPIVKTELNKWYTELSGALDAKLPTWQAAFEKWIAAMWEWITEASGEAIRELGIWAADVGNYLINTALPQFRTKMLEWATALVEWIGSESADALPELGTWLGKVLAWAVAGAASLVVEMAKFAAAIIDWIPDAIDDLPAKLAELKDAMIGWIAGTGGGGTEGSLVAEADPAMEKFKEALLTALDRIKEGFIAAGQNFVRAFADTLSEYIDWEFVGTNIMTFVRNGISSMLDPIVSRVSEIAQAASDVLTTVVDWLQRGVEIIQLLIDGLASMIGGVTAQIGEIAQAAYDAFFETDWLQVGIDIIEGVLDGLKEKGDSIVQYLRDLAQQAWDAIDKVFIFGSPSRLMIQAGREIIEGWMIGMIQAQRRLFNAIQHISDSIARIAGRAGANAVAAYTSALSSFSSVGGSLLDRIGMSGPSWVSQLIGDEQRTLEFLQEQADLIEAIRASGADPADVLRGVTLGPNADPVRLAQIVGFTMANLNHQLMISLQNAASGLDREIENARARREDIAEIEERSQEQTFDARSNYARRLASIDEQIAQAEEDAIRTGNRNVLLRIQSLDNQRDAIVREFEMLLAHQRQLDDILSRQPVSENQRGQAAIERWRQTMIEPLMNGFEHLSAGLRAARLQEIDRNMRLIQGFAAQLPSLAGAEARLMQALEGFGTGARNRAEQLLNLVYDPRMASVAAQRAHAVHEFANSLINLRGELERMSGRRLSGESIVERMMGGFDQMTAYQQALEAVDRQIAGIEAHIMETGNVNSLNAVRALDATRAQRQADIENFIRQSQALEHIMRQVKNLSGPGQASAERFFQEQIQTIADAFSSPMRSVDRDAWIRTAQMRVEMINRFVEQMRQLERVQNRVAGNQAFAHLADEFATLQDILMPEQQRASLINQLNSYITQMMRLHQIQQDISAGRGINPIVERFASERLDAVARQLENINLTEAERNRLIEQYRIEQEKIIRLQEKQQQLEFINQQLALIQQLRDLDEKEDWSVNVENILSGIRFGMNASIDDLMLLTGRVLDELVRFANYELGIASPSKVFAKVGTNIMAGLESGILAGMRQPMSALRSAAGNLIPYTLSQRALTINMGGVTINDGIDAVMFEARIRQIVRSEFAA